MRSPNILCLGVLAPQSAALGPAALTYESLAVLDLLPSLDPLNSVQMVCVINNARWFPVFKSSGPRCLESFQLSFQKMGGQGKPSLLACWIPNPHNCDTYIVKWLLQATHFKVLCFTTIVTQTKFSLLCLHSFSHCPAFFYDVHYAPKQLLKIHRILLLLLFFTEA